MCGAGREGAPGAQVAASASSRRARRCWVAGSGCRLERTPKRHRHGALTGYPGVLAYRVRNGHGPTAYEEWRGLKSSGQLSVGHVAHQVFTYFRYDYTSLQSWQYPAIHARIRRLVHKASSGLGIRRYSVNRRGHKYRTFNVAEAEAVYALAIEMPKPIPEDIQRPMHVCPGCRELGQVQDWRPPEGIDPSMRKVKCERCDLEFYVAPDAMPGGAPEDSTPVLAAIREAREQRDDNYDHWCCGVDTGDLWEGDSRDFPF